MTTSGTTINPLPGELVLLPFPFTDLSGNKRRPVLVLAAADTLGDFIAVPVTSQPGHSGFISLGSQQLADGALPKDSWIKADKPFTLNRSLVFLAAQPGNPARPGP
jgi:mRNA interferase MazF